MGRRFGTVPDGKASLEMRMALALIRYGTIPEVARFECGSVVGLSRGVPVVVETHRGLQVGTFLERLTPVHRADRDPLAPEQAPPRPLLRVASDADLDQTAELAKDAQSEFQQWSERIAAWDLALELIDLEWTLDRTKLILYVLSERGPDCTRLALQAAADGLGTIEVQPVSLEGLVSQPESSAGGCGTGGCGCG